MDSFIEVFAFIVIGAILVLIVAAVTANRRNSELPEKQGETARPARRDGSDHRSRAEPGSSAADAFPFAAMADTDTPRSTGSSDSSYGHSSSHDSGSSYSSGGDSGGGGGCD